MGSLVGCSPMPVASLVLLSVRFRVAKDFAPCLGEFQYVLMSSSGFSLVSSSGLK